MIANIRVLALIIFFLAIPFLQAENLVLKYDLSLGMGRKDAKKALENAGYEIEDEIKISKQMRSFMVNGFIYKNLTDSQDTEKSTELDFYDNGLMNTTLFVKSKDYMVNNELTKTYLAELTGLYGEHSAYEKVMNIKSWMWMAGNTKILLNSDSRKKTAKISLIYLPLYAKKYEDEVKVKLKGKPFDPVDDMILK
ncbi:MAG: hypothetical protein GWO07_00315 [Candidatus Dadabacteria bacterium]|nr:hypothetical protein [Candidatus Dadabacteria bacterium]NIS07224.1 hypothetical protein [Candidatus Dadabacteria bacterium]NIV40931.1 hypothetical protein [Candidatus Dadabacteria bacterium]NIX14363.1 hypothetical protein [Candidatus Dadabacteria bacterium]NIY20881.1 hypothetical protein [Candidatus Dadabacteria bacterium]